MQLATPRATINTADYVLFNYGAASVPARAATKGLHSRCDNVAGTRIRGAKTLIDFARNDTTPGSVTHFSVGQETAHGPKWRFAAMRNFSCEG